MSDLVTFSVRHREGCEAVDADPGGCTCAPAVCIREDDAGDWRLVAELEAGWTRADLADVVTSRASRGTLGAQRCDLDATSTTHASPCNRMRG